MPSLEHNGLVDLFRRNPGLVPEVLEKLLHVPVPPHASVKVADSNLDELIPIEFRADLVIESRDAAGNLVLTAILEVQRSPDPDKLFSWPVYITVSRSQRRCETCVLVVAPDVEIAAWAAQPIKLGPGLSVVTPLVLGPTEVPVITDAELARCEPELAVLSARAHGNGPNGLAVVLAALAALERFDPDTASVYLAIIYEALREPARRALEALLMERQALGPVTLPPFAQRIENEGIRKGKAEGKVEGMREALLRLVAALGLSLEEEEHARIEMCSDAAELGRWFNNAIHAKSTADIFR